MSKAVHHKSGRLMRGACGASYWHATTNPAEVTCKRCVFVMLLQGEIDRNAARVTDSMRRRGGFH